MSAAGKFRFVALLAAVTGLAMSTPLMNWPDLLGRPAPKADARIAYGQDRLQYVELWRPAGKGPFPVVVMVHGGCWQSSVAKASIMDYIAGDLRDHGVAVWNLEYRGIDRPGGGYPGTFQDVAAGADALRAEAAKQHLDLKHVLVIGHSAGGHLALWLAARGAIPDGSPLHSAHPLKVDTAISLGGLPDLEAAASPPGDTCGPETVPQLVGAAARAGKDPYADTSPARLAQPHARVILINASRDRIAPPAFATAYKARVGGRVETITVPDEGHVELIAPGARAWTRARETILAALGVKG
jgi:acetyl esterase/lipase